MELIQEGIELGLLLLVSKLGGTHFLVGSVADASAKKELCHEEADQSCGVFVETDLGVVGSTVCEIVSCVLEIIQIAEIVECLL